jgi:UDP-3-O-[3-hydroxymyristoyl] glucosamine N-acyltransferase
MVFQQKHTLQQIATILNCRFVGSADFPVLGMNEIHVVNPGDIVFVDHPKYYDVALQSDATVVLINKEVDCPQGKALLISDDPFRDFNTLTSYFKPFEKASKSISDSALIGKNTIIQPNSFIGNNVIIGDNTVIHANVAIYDNTVIGNHVTIHSGTVIGADAFYYKKRPEAYDKLRSGGHVLIEDHVEIGALCTIDKGVTAATTIGEGTKIDNHVQIGHDTIIGKHCLFAAQVGIAGCVVVEDEVTLWGQVGVISGITIGKGSVVYAQSGVGKTLAGHQKYFGSPADEARIKMRELAALKELPTLIKSLDK